MRSPSHGSTDHKLVPCEGREASCCGETRTQQRHGGACEKFTSTQTTRWGMSKSMRPSFQAEARCAKGCSDWGARGMLRRSQYRHDLAES
jgi:hypothetical protein